MTITSPASTVTPPVGSGAAPVTSLAALAELVARDGIADHHDALVAAIRGSELARSFPVLAELAIDATAPPVARERAIGRLASIEGTRIAPPRPAPVVWEPRAA